jgi:5,10-methylenetetrahydromethanopterin reductase
MRFGLRFNSDSGSIREIVRWAQLAEELGFDDFWYCQDLMKRDAWVALTAVASATQRIRIGTCIVNPFSSSPAEIAMAAASLQEYSAGRFVLGIGPGDPPYLHWIGQAQAQPRSGLAAAVQILRRLLAGEPVGATAAPFANWDHTAKLRFDLPSQPVPIYIGGQGPRVLELAGEVADGALPILFRPKRSALCANGSPLERHALGATCANSIWRRVSGGRLRHNAPPPRMRCATWWPITAPRCAPKHSHPSA